MNGHQLAAIIVFFIMGVVGYALSYFQFNDPYGIFIPTASMSIGISIGLMMFERTKNSHHLYPNSKWSFKVGE